MLNDKYIQAIEMYNRGLSIQDCADYFDISRQGMHKILQRRGVKFRSNLKYGKENHFHRGGSLHNKRVGHLVQMAIKKGILVPELCEVQGCKVSPNEKNVDGRSIIQSHHDDYNKPLEVRWFCQKHHHEWHKNNTALPLSSELPRMEQKEIAILGGKSSWKNMTKAQRKERSKKMSNARWGKS